ncbi:sigma-70 family RNA polymerase sigma factor [Myxococcota bacterium]|nr:sigma-70 family RNA polymerase sigma factor [Myxococcota bacterium]
MGEQHDHFEERIHEESAGDVSTESEGEQSDRSVAGSPIQALPVAQRRNRAPARRASEEPVWVSDQELVHQILAGSREHFDLLYETYFPRVYRFALKRLGDAGEAEDVAQEVFMTLMTALASFKGESTLLVWIFGVTRNKVNRRFRRPRPRLEPLEEGGALDIESGGPMADEAVDARRMLGRCESVIENDLTPLQRRIFHLKHLRRQPIRAIALALGKSEDAVKANLYRMRRAISDGTPGLEGLLQN